MMDLNVLNAPWQEPSLPDAIAQGDMPGDKICIGQEHVKKAGTIFPELQRRLGGYLCANPSQRAVVCVCGGSGVGKSEIASLLTFYLNNLGIGAYTLSGDNYPRRYPALNDAERMRVFRNGGLKGLLVSGGYDASCAGTLKRLWEEDRDAAAQSAQEHPWLKTYQKAGRDALRGYLGTNREIDFEELEHIVAQFKQGAPRLYLKRMGRSATELWYDDVDMTNVHVLMIEWTHGNSNWFQGVDIAVLLNSTPAETLAHRRARNRDGRADSPFTTMVLEIEQQLLMSQAKKAQIILSRSGELITYEAYRKLMTNA